MAERGIDAYKITGSTVPDIGEPLAVSVFQDLVKQFGMQPSMSRKGNCYDNSPMESFSGTLKNGPVHHRRYETRAQAIAEITESIEIFYNRQQRQSKLGYLSPAVFAQQFYRQQQAA